MEQTASEVTLFIQFSYIFTEMFHESLEGWKVGGPDDLPPGFVRQPISCRVREGVLQSHAPCQQEPPITIVDFTAGMESRHCQNTRRKYLIIYNVQSKLKYL